MTVGRAEGHVFTSREAHIQHLLEVALQPGAKTYTLHSEDSKAFFDQVNKTVLEYLIAKEAENFSTVKLATGELEAALTKLPRELFTSTAWRGLEVSEKEWKEIYRRKVQAEKFIRFRAQSSVIPITDQEVRRYHEENRTRFGTLPLDQFKENIRIFLRRSQVESRLKDWYEVLRAKYSARNFLSEI